jgi:hypothetical protein
VDPGVLQRRIAVIVLDRWVRPGLQQQLHHRVVASDRCGH